MEYTTGAIYLGPKGLFTPNDSVTNVTLTGKMDMHPILPVTVPVKKIKGTARQCYGDGDGVVRCEQTFNSSLCP